MILENVVIRVDKNSGIQTVCLNPKGLVTHINVTVVWLGGGDYPCLPIPPGVTLTTDVNVYLDAAAAWKAAHPGL
jgi:hypothetical protein